MKNLKLLNKKYLAVIIFYLFFGVVAQSQEPVDIWNIEEKKTNENISVHHMIFSKRNKRSFTFHKLFSWFHL